MAPHISKTFGPRPATVWRSSPAIEPASTRSASTSSGGSASTGGARTPTTSKSWTTTRRTETHGYPASSRSSRRDSPRGVLEAPRIEPVSPGQGSPGAGPPDQRDRPRETEPLRGHGAAPGSLLPELPPVLAQPPVAL